MMFQGKISCQDDDWYYLDYDSYMEMVEGGDQCIAYSMMRTISVKRVGNFSTVILYRKKGIGLRVASKCR
jgi:hypothetical protein